MLSLRQQGLEMVFDAIDSGISKNDLATAFKVEIGLIEDGEITSFKNMVNMEQDYEESLESTILSLTKKFPDLINAQVESIYRNECTPTEERIDRYFEDIDQLRGIEFDFPVLNKTEAINDEEECNACGGSCARVWTMLGCSTVGCIVGLKAGPLGCAFGIWGCACAVCPMDLPWWLGREACGGGKE